MSVKISWSGKAIQNLSKYPKAVIDILVTQAQISQAKIANAAKADHGDDAHSMDRYVSRTGILTQSIMPGALVVTDKGVSFAVIAAVDYAGYVEGEESMKKSSVGVYPFLTPAAKEELPFFTARLRQSMEGMHL